MILLGIEQSAYNRFQTLEESVQKIKEHGFDCMDYQEFVATDGNPMFESMDEEAFAAYLKEQKEVFDRYGVKIFQTHSPWRYPPVEATQQEQEARLQQMIRAVMGTALLGCDRMVVHAMMPDGTHNIGKEANALAVNRWFLKELCDAGQKYGVSICLENMPMLRFNIATVQQVLDLVKEINHPMLKVCLDTGHALIFEHSIGDAVRLIGKDLLYALHVHDNDGKADRHWRPFEGVADWEDFAAALKEIGFEGCLSLECGADAKIPAELLEGELRTLRERAAYLQRKASNS